MSQLFERFDDYLFTIVKETGGLEGFLNTVFYFLKRRTDFYYESDPGDKMGFPPGMNKQIVFNIIQKYQDEHYKKYPQKSIEQYQQKMDQFKQIQEQQKQQIEIQNNQQQQEKQQNIIQQQKQIDQQKEKQNQVIKNQIQKSQDLKETQIVDQKQEQSQKEEQIYFSTYNGGKTDKYSWSQNINDVTVLIYLKEKTKAKDMEVQIKSDRLSIKYKNQQDYILNGELYDLVKSEDSIWQIEDGKTMMITLDKQNENIWKTIIKGDIEIDATKVDNSKKLEDFDWETQGALRKVMYEQQRKQQGLPTTEEEKQMEILKKAWDSDGSPFKGTQFDPSKFNIQQ